MFKENRKHFVSFRAVIIFKIVTHLCLCHEPPPASPPPKTSGLSRFPPKFYIHLYHPTTFLTVSSSVRDLSLFFFPPKLFREGAMNNDSTVEISNLKLKHTIAMTKPYCPSPTIMHFTRWWLLRWEVSTVRKYFCPLRLGNTPPWDARPLLLKRYQETLVDTVWVPSHTSQM